MGEGQWRAAGLFPDRLRAWDIILMEPSGNAPAEILLSGLGIRGGLHKLSPNPDTGRFEPDGDTAWHLPASPENSRTGLLLADFNRDGRKDLAVARFRPGSASLFMAGETGTWTECLFDPGDPDSSAAPFWGLNAADLNADGKMDLVANQGTEGIGNLLVWIQK
jgi:hypothetical protein